MTAPNGGDCTRRCDEPERNEIPPHQHHFGGDNSAHFNFPAHWGFVILLVLVHEPTPAGLWAGVVALGQSRRLVYIGRVVAVP